MKRFIYTLLVAATTLFLVLPLLASENGSEVGDEGFSVGSRATYFKPKDAVKGSWFIGAQARLHMSPLGFEASIDYRKNEFADGVTIKGFPVQATLLIYLIPRSPISPFLLGGVGWYYTQVESPLMAKKTENRFGPHAGVGLEAMLSSSLSLDASYRYIWLVDVTSKDTNAFEKTYRDSGEMVTIALNFVF